MLVGVTNSSIELYCEKLTDNLGAVHISARVCIMRPFISFLFVLGLIRLHRSTIYVDVVCCYRLSSVVCWSVCLSVCNTVGLSH